MKNLSVAHYILFGLFGWGIPGTIVAGSSAVLITFVAMLPVWLAARQPLPSSKDEPVTIKAAGAMLVLVLIYLLMDATIGRQKFSANMFLSANATGDFIESANESVSQGRGVVELLGSLMIFLPYALIDTSRKAPILGRLVMGMASALFVFYDVGISRGYLLMAVLAVGLGNATKLRNVLWAGLLSLVGFVAASAARGDFNDVAFSNPLFDSVAWPFINLALMLDGDCGRATWLEFAIEFAKKFLPAFIVPKDIFSFNIEMTRCIYPMFGDAVDSISIFTWLGEMYYYQPSIPTALSAGLLLAIVARLLDVRLARMGMTSTRVFAGMMCIVLLRSRVLDVLSFLMFLLIFLYFWRGFQRSWHRPLPGPARSSSPSTK